MSGCWRLGSSSMLACEGRASPCAQLGGLGSPRGAQRTAPHPPGVLAGVGAGHLDLAEVGHGHDGHRPVERRGRRARPHAQPADRGDARQLTDEPVEPSDTRSRPRIGILHQLHGGEVGAIGDPHAGGVHRAQLSGLPHREQRPERRVEAEGVVPGQQRTARDGDGGTRLVVGPVAVRHHEREPVRGSPQGQHHDDRRRRETGGRGGGRHEGRAEGHHAAGGGSGAEEAAPGHPGGTEVAAGRGCGSSSREVVGVVEEDHDQPGHPGRDQGV